MWVEAESSGAYSCYEDFVEDTVPYLRKEMELMLASVRIRCNSAVSTMRHVLYHLGSQGVAACAARVVPNCAVHVSWLHRMRCAARRRTTHRQYFRSMTPTCASSSTMLCERSMQMLKLLPDSQWR